jgi:hypothetical protein
MKQMRLRTTSGEFVVVGTGDQLFDAATVNVGEQIGSYITNSELPVGTYDAMSPVLAGIWSVRGQHEQAVDGGPGDCVTTATGGSTNLADKATLDVDFAQFVRDNGSPSPDTFEENGNIVIVDTSANGLPLTVTPNTVVNVDLAFDVASGVTFTFVNGVCTRASLGPAMVTVSFTTSTQ